MIDRMSTAEDSKSVSARFTRRALVVVAIVTAVVLVLVFLWNAVNVLLLVFAGVLLAVLLRALAGFADEHTPLSGGWALAAVVLALLALLGLAGWLLLPIISGQFGQLVEQLPRAVARLRQRIESYRWGQLLLAQAPAPGPLAGSSGSLFSRVTGTFSVALDVVVDIVVILFVGLYLAADPRLYTQGLFRLVPIAARPRAREVQHALGATLRWWLLGQIFSMTVIGVLTTLGLWLIGVPLAVVLGILAGLLEFIPTFGPVMAAVPAVLLALVDSPIQALYVIILYVAIQAIESYLLLPLVQQRTVDLPPVITITSVVLLGTIFGFLGLLLATPLAAAALVLVRMLYVEDVLGDPVDVPGESAG